MGVPVSQRYLGFLIKAKWLILSGWFALSLLTLLWGRSSGNALINETHTRARAPQGSASGRAERLFHTYWPERGVEHTCVVVVELLEDPPLATSLADPPIADGREHGRALEEDEGEAGDELGPEGGEEVVVRRLNSSAASPAAATPGAAVAPVAVGGEPARPDEPRLPSVLTNWTRNFTLELAQSVYNYAAEPSRANLLMSVWGYYLVDDTDYRDVGFRWLSPDSRSTIIAVNYNKTQEKAASRFVVFVQREVSRIARELYRREREEAQTAGRPWRRTHAVGVTSPELLAEDSARESQRHFLVMYATVLPLALLFHAAWLRALKPLMLHVCMLAGSTLFSFFLLREPLPDDIQMPWFAPSMTLGLCMAMSLNYSFFLLARFQEEYLREEKPTEECVGVLLERTGRMILLSGSALLVAFGGLCFVPLEFLQATGIASAAAVFVSMLCALTLAPAFLLAFGPYLFSPSAISPMRWLPLQGRLAWVNLWRRCLPLARAINLCCGCLCDAATSRALRLTKISRNRFGNLVDDSGFPLADRDTMPLLMQGAAAVAVPPGAPPVYGPGKDRWGAAAAAPASGERMSTFDDFQGYMQITDGVADGPGSSDRRSGGRFLSPSRRRSSSASRNSGGFGAVRTAARNSLRPGPPVGTFSSPKAPLGLPAPASSTSLNDDSGSDDGPRAGGRRPVVVLDEFSVSGGARGSSSDGEAYYGYDSQDELRGASAAYADEAVAEGSDDEALRLAELEESRNAIHVMRMKEAALNRQLGSFWYKLAAWLTRGCNATLVLVLLLAIVVPVAISTFRIQPTADNLLLSPRNSPSRHLYDHLRDLGFQSGRADAYFILMLVEKLPPPPPPMGSRLLPQALPPPPPPPPEATGLALRPRQPLGQPDDDHSEVVLSQGFWTGGQTIVRYLLRHPKRLVKPSGIFSITYYDGRSVTLDQAKRFLSRDDDESGNPANATVYRMLYANLTSPVAPAAAIQIETAVDPLGPDVVSWIRDVREFLDWLNGNSTFRPVDFFPAGEATGDPPTDKYRLRFELFGGATRELDSMERVTSALPKIVGVLAAVIAVLFAVGFQSLVAPVRLMFGIGLSMLWVYGLGVLVFQDASFFSDLGITPENSTGIHYYSIVISLFLLLAFTLDYDALLMLRIIEFRRHGFNTKASIIKGVYKTGGQLLTAGLTMTLVFGGLLFSSAVILKQIGLFLAIGLLMDVLVIRGVFIPSLMALLGTANWWPGSHRMPPEILDEFYFDDQVLLSHSAGAQMQKDLTVERVAATQARAEEYRVERVLTERQQQQLSHRRTQGSAATSLLDDYYDMMQPPAVGAAGDHAFYEGMDLYDGDGFGGGPRDDSSDSLSEGGY